MYLLTTVSTVSFASEVCKTDSDELLSQLLSNHPSVKMSQEVIKGAKERVDSAYWGFFPTPSVDVSGKDSDRHTAVARLDQPILTGGKLTSKYDMATSKEKENVYELEENSYKLIESYLNILESYLQSKSNIIELQEGADNLSKFSEMLDRRMEVGVSSTSDKDLLSARIEQVSSDKMLAKNKYKVATLQLELILDRKINCDIDFRDITTTQNSDIEESIKKLLEFHPSLKKTSAQIETSKFEQDSTEASIMPNLNLRVERREGDLYSDNYDKSNDQNIVYLAFTATTRAGLSSISDIAAAKIKINEIEYRKKLLKKN